MILCEIHSISVPLFVRDTQSTLEEAQRPGSGPLETKGFGALCRRAKGFVKTMKAWRSGALVVLIVLSAGIVVSSPALATPNITASSGTGVASPFLTPMGNTRDSSSRGSSTDTRLVLNGTTITCRTANAVGYTATTHTQLRLTSMTFGDGRGSTCITSGRVPIVGDSINGGASSVVPWHVHVKTNDAGARSATGTINISTSFSFTASNGVTTCDFTVSGSQSVTVTYTYSSTSLIVDGALVVGVTRVAGSCPTSGSADFRAAYTVRPDTSNHRVTVTNDS
jgi:hypothetical protein